MAFSVVGLVFVASAAPSLLSSGPLLAGVQAVLGLLLYFGGRRLAAAWHRKAGAPAPE